MLKQVKINETFLSAIIVLSTLIGSTFLFSLKEKRPDGRYADISAECAAHIVEITKFEPLANFEQYPVKDIYSEKSASLDLNSSYIAREFKTTIENALREGVNFAGHYVIAGWGFTGRGGEIAIVDIKTGKAFPFPYSAYIDFEYRKDSNLIIIDPLWMIEETAKTTDCINPPTSDFAEIRPYYFLWEDGSLKFIGPKYEMKPLKAEHFIY